MAIACRMGSLKVVTSFWLDIHHFRDFQRLLKLDLLVNTLHA